jgi:hypothetical protein
MLKQTKDIKAGNSTPSLFNAASTIVQHGREEQPLINLKPVF